MDIREEVALHLAGRLKAELDRAAIERDWRVPVEWSDQILRIVQRVLDEEKFEIARSLGGGIASPVSTIRLIN